MSIYLGSLKVKLAQYTQGLCDTYEKQTNILYKKGWTKYQVRFFGKMDSKKVKEGAELTASRHSCRCSASELFKEEILFDPESPLAKAMTASLVLVSPSTCKRTVDLQINIRTPTR